MTFEDLKPTWLREATSMVVVASIMAEVENKRKLGVTRSRASRGTNSALDRRRGKLYGYVPSLAQRLGLTLKNMRCTVLTQGKFYKIYDR